MQILISTLRHALAISVFVFAMMVIIDYINVLSKDKFRTSVRRSKLEQYILASFLGSTPGCLGAFTNVTMYVHGLISFGALVGGMIATSGDEAFVMLAMFPKTAILLFVILFVLGIAVAWIADLFVEKTRIKTCENCMVKTYHKKEESFGFTPSPLRLILMAFAFGLLALIFLGAFGPQESWMRATFLFTTIILGLVFTISSEHYIKEHIWKHIIRKHLLSVFLWTFFSLLLINIVVPKLNLEGFISSHPALILIIAALVGIIPESGPHLIFVTMYANGLIPFSILLASSIVQDGHGMLPLLSYSIKDSILTKVINIFVGISIGFVLLAMGF